MFLFCAQAQPYDTFDSMRAEALNVIQNSQNVLDGWHVGEDRSCNEFCVAHQKAFVPEKSSGVVYLDTQEAILRDTGDCCLSIGVHISPNKHEQFEMFASKWEGFLIYNWFSIDFVAPKKRLCIPILDGVAE